MASNIKLLRLWLSGQSGPLGLLLATGFALLFAALVMTPIGPPVLLQGTIVGFGHSQARGGSGPFAVVRLTTGDATIGLPQASNCRLGDPVQVKRQRRPWGQFYYLSSFDCH